MSAPDTTDGIRLDDSLWPVIVTTAPPGHVDDTQLLAYIKRFDDVTIQRGGAYAHVLDLRGNSGLTPRQRKLLAEAQSHRDGFKGCEIVAGAMVMDSQLLRGMLTALFWLKRPKHEVRVFANLESAIAWSRTKIAAAA